MRISRYKYLKQSFIWFQWILRFFLDLAHLYCLLVIFFGRGGFNEIFKGYVGFKRVLLDF